MIFGISENGLGAAVILPVLVKRRRGGFKPEGNFEFGEDMQQILAIVVVA